MTADPVLVLVVDDLPEQRLTIEATLADLGERVISVSSGLEALKYLLTHEVALILLDVNMPEMDGFETATIIRGRPKNVDTPIIFLTADHDAMQASRGYALGAVDYITCPFLPAVLRAKVGVFVALSRAQARIREEAEARAAFEREQAEHAAAEEQNRRMRLLGDAGVVVSGPLESAPFESGLLRVIVPELADEASLRFAGGGDGDDTCLCLRAGSDSIQSIHTESSALAALHRVTLVTRAPVETLPDRSGRPQQVALPLTMYGRTVATLAVSRRESQSGYTPEERELLRLIAERASVALDNRRLYRELQDRDRRKDEFLAMLSHELRNPLGAITSAAYLLELVNASDDVTIRARQVISRQSAYLARIVDDLLDVSRVTTGRITLTKVVLDLREMVDSTIEALRSSGRITGHALTVSGDSVHVEVDVTRMEQVLTNLIVNAIKYTDPGGTIAIEVDSTPEHAILRVIDDGIGIPPELLQNMFDLFVQGGQSLDRGQGGLGIGLTVVRKLVELQGGSVHAHSDGTGKGSTFVIRLPRVFTTPESKDSDPRDEVSDSSLRLLLVDDNEDARSMLRTYFELQRHKVHEAANGPEAVELALRVRPDVAFVDLGLPGFDGHEVARRLRHDERTRHTLLVAITGYGQPEDRERSAEAGFDSHLVKPPTPERLHDVLARAATRLTGNHAAAPAD